MLEKENFYLNHGNSSHSLKVKNIFKKQTFFHFENCFPYRWQRS